MSRNPKLSEQNLRHAVECNDPDALWALAQALDDPESKYKPKYKDEADDLTVKAAENYVYDSYGAAAVVHLKRNSPENAIKAVVLLGLCCMRGDVDAMSVLGALLTDRCSGSVEASRIALHLFYCAAIHGDTSAYADLGKAYSECDGCNHDYGASFKWLRKSLDANDPIGIFYLGVYYENGYGGSPDMSRAIQYYELAAEKGHENAVVARVRLAVKNNDKSNKIQGFVHELELLVTKQFSKRAEFVLGQCYLLGIGVVHNHKRGAKLVHVSVSTVDRRDVDLLAMAAGLFIEGKIIKKNIALGRELLNKCVQYQCKMGMTMYVAYILDGIFENDVYFAESINVQILQVDRSHVVSNYLQGIIERRRHRYSSAARHFLIAANGGFIDAWVALGMMYENGGANFPSDTQLAVECFSHVPPQLYRDDSKAEVSSLSLKHNHESDEQSASSSSSSPSNEDEQEPAVEPQECPICLLVITSSCCTLPCNHVICHDCAVRFFVYNKQQRLAGKSSSPPSCPMCRALIHDNDYCNNVAI